MITTEEKTIVQKAREEIGKKYPGIHPAIITDIFARAVEAKADEDQEIISLIEAKSYATRRMAYVS